MSEQVETRTLRFERVFKVSPQRLYDAWTKPEELIQWWGPETVTICDYSMDVSPGGFWTTTMLSPEGQKFIVQGEYTRLEPPHRLGFTWAWLGEDGPGHKTEVDIRFEALDDGGTRMFFEQQVFADQEDRDNHGQGWESSMKCLDGYLAKQEG